ncbi:MAG: nucleotidyl transferase AbiEii/AbiGii toxin family protein [Candidatus Kerfeldbacteria bacterium]|nr:nucleotidyl transferase AbiEii/AbiGii toxin family protein [Candidatus Kerfeldbacteria bacterium]
MGRILRDVYSDTTIAPLLGFKGGTCAYFFYHLPRFSVDLDFDILQQVDDTICQQVFGKLKNILKPYGEIKDSQIKRFTIFLFLSYGDSDHNIKFEVNLRSHNADVIMHYELKEYLGISMLVGKKDYLFATKLAALTLRTEIAMRDIYDIWFFAKNNWDINVELVETLTGKSLVDHLADVITTIEQVKDNQILQGLGELISEPEKIWAKKHLRQEAIFFIRNYQAVLTQRPRPAVDIS